MARFKMCKICGEEFNFYPGERCGDCAPRHTLVVLMRFVIAALACGAVLGRFLSGILGYY